MMKSFFKTLKYEEVYLCKYETFADVVVRLPYFKKEANNLKRLHPGLGYLLPNDFDELMITQAHDKLPG